MEKYDISQKITFKTGTYELNSDANFNFQLNRVIMWDGGDADEVAAVSQNIKTSSDWVSAMEQLAEKAHAEGRTANEIAYLRMSEFFIEKDSALVAKVIEYIQGIAEVKVFRLTGQRSRELNTAIDENEHANSAMELKLIPFMTVQSFWLKAIGTIIVLASVLLHIGGSMDLLTTIIMIISSYLIYAQLDNAGKYSALLRTVDVCVSQAQDVLKTPQMDISGKDIAPENCNISAENISFAYDSKAIIDGISLSIPEHTTTALVGPSGGGKTTLTSLLSRFWDVDEGKVTLGGRDVREYSMDALMRNFSFVFQSVYLFADTIANNIRFGQPDAPMEKVVEAAKKACCHDFIMALPDGYDTVIGEGGASLSGGEKQRISIARAIMKDAPIIVLDEASKKEDIIHILLNAVDRQSIISELTKAIPSEHIPYVLKKFKKYVDKLPANQK